LSLYGPCAGRFGETLERLSIILGHIRMS
jgi:hypothetical protein